MTTIASQIDLGSACLTPAQYQLVHALEAYRQEHGISPTYVELGEAMGGISAVTIHEHVNALIVKGVLTKDGRRSRSLMLATKYGQSRQRRLELADAVCVAIGNRYADFAAVSIGSVGAAYQAWREVAGLDGVG